MTTENENVTEHKPEKNTKVHSHKHYTFLVLAIAVLLMVISFKYFDPNDANSPSYGSAIRINAVALQSVSLWLLAFLGFVTGLNRMGYDVYKEIVKDQNVALSILIGFAGLAMAICIHG